MFPKSRLVCLGDIILSHEQTQCGFGVGDGDIVGYGDCDGDRVDDGAGDCEGVGLSIT